MTEESSPAADLMRLATAYQASATLHAAVRLGIADALDPGPRSVAGIADAIGGNVHAAALRRLLRALVALGVVEEAPRGTFALSAAGRTLATGTPGSLRDLVLFFGHADMWRSWIELERCIRTGQTAGMLLFGSEDPFARYATDPDFGPVFNRGMTANSTAAAAKADCSPRFWQRARRHAASCTTFLRLSQAQGRFSLLRVLLTAARWSAATCSPTFPTAATSTC